MVGWLVENMSCGWVGRMFAIWVLRIEGGLVRWLVCYWFGRIFKWWVN